MITEAPESLAALRKLIETELASSDEVLVHLRDVLYPLGERAEGDGNPITRAIAYLESEKKLIVRPTRERSEFAAVLKGTGDMRTPGRSRVGPRGAQSSAPK